MTILPFLKRGAALAQLLSEKRTGRTAAGLSYFLTLSLFPLLICVSAIADFANLENAALTGFLAQIAPESALLVITDYLGYVSGHQSGPMLAGGITVMLTSTAAGFRMLLHGIDDLYGKRTRAGFRTYVLSLLSSLVFLLSLCVSAAMLASGRWLLTLLEGVIPMSGFFRQWLWLRYLFLFLFIALILWLLFRLTAPRGGPRLPVAACSLGTAAALVAVSAVFSRFIALSPRYSLIYGSLAAVIILMLWFYLCAAIVMAGAAVNALRFLGIEGAARIKDTPGAAELLRMPEQALFPYRLRKPGNRDAAGQAKPGLTNGK